LERILQQRSPIRCKIENISPQEIELGLQKSFLEEIKNRNKTLQNKEEIKNILHKIACWLLATTPGLMICGNTGTGKTTIAKALITFFNAYNQFYNTECFRANVEKLSGYSLNQIAKDDKEFQRIKGTLRLFIDDIGVETTDVKSYGTALTPFAELLHERYENQTVTILTTNLSMEQLREKYGERTFSRLNEMFARVTLTGKDLRLTQNII